MTEPTRLWSIWQALLQRFAWAFTRPGFRRFAEWITALALNVEEHTVTQSVLAIERPDDWKAMESFAEYGARRTRSVADALTRLVEKAPGRLWHGFHVSAVDDTKVHRCGEHVWGTCTFHEYTARCPNRATTVRAHNWVVLGALLHKPERPAWFLPISGRLYFRKSQLPERPGVPGRKEVFRTKCELAVELVREQAETTGGRLTIDNNVAERRLRDQAIGRNYAGLRIIWSRPGASLATSGFLPSPSRSSADMTPHNSDALPGISISFPGGLTCSTRSFNGPITCADSGPTRSVPPSTNSPAT